MSRKYTLSNKQSLNVLESTLHTYGIEKYLPIFKKYGIDTKTLRLLCDDDLKTIGIEDASLRAEIVKECKNMPKTKDNKAFEVNEEYLFNALYDMEQHMKILHASLSICIVEKEPMLSDIKLTKSVDTLLFSLNSLNRELECFSNKFDPNVKKTKWKHIVAIIISSSATIYLFKKYWFS